MTTPITVTLDTLYEIERRIDWLAPIELRDDGARLLFGIDGAEYYFPAEIWYTMLRTVIARQAGIGYRRRADA